MSDNKRDDGKYRNDDEVRSGHNKYDVLSVLQKSIRRGDREKAMWAAWSLTRSGMAGLYWHRIKVIMLEDCLLPPEEAHVIQTVQTLNELATGKWDSDEGMGVAAAMRCASILAMCTGSYETLLMKSYWSNVAEEGDDIKEIQKQFPIPPEHENLGKVGRICHDMHTYKGKKRGENYASFLISASRTDTMTDLGRDYRRQLMEMLSYKFTDEQIEAATTPVTEQEDAWDDPSVGFPRH